MAVLYKGQDYRLTLETGLALAGATVLKVLYKKPDGTKGFWTPTITALTSIYYDVTPANNNMAGDWYFESYVEIGGRTYLGETVVQTILDNIK